MGNKLTKNYLYNLAYQIINLIFPLITTPYISRVLGADGVGIYSYTLSIVTYFILFGSLGMSLYAQRQIAFVQNRPHKRTQVFYETLLLRAVTLSVSTAIFSITFAIGGEYADYYKILIVYILASIFDISHFFQGMEEFQKIVTRNFVVKIVSIFATFIFVKDADDIGIYLLIYSLSNLIGNITLWLWLPKYLKKPNVREMNIFKHIKPVIAIFIPQIATQIYTVLDKVMLGALLEDKAEVGYYEQSYKIILILITIVTSLGTVMMPNIASKFANKQTDEIKPAIKRSFRFVFLMAFPLMFGMLAISSDLIPRFLGEGFEKSIYVSYMLSPVVLLVGLSNVTGIQYLLPTLRQKQYTFSVIAGAVANLLINFILIPRFQSVGAGLCTLIAELVVTSFQFFCIRKEFSVKDILETAIKYFIAGVIMFGVILVLNTTVLIGVSPLLRMGFDLCIGGTIYIAALFVMRDDLIPGFLNDLRNKNAED